MTYKNIIHIIKNSDNNIYTDKKQVWSMNI